MQLCHSIEGNEIVQMASLRYLALHGGGDTWKLEQKVGGGDTGSSNKRWYIGRPLFAISLPSCIPQGRSRIYRFSIGFLYVVYRFSIGILYGFAKTNNWLLTE